MEFSVNLAPAKLRRVWILVQSAAKEIEFCKRLAHLEQVHAVTRYNRAKQPERSAVALILQFNEIELWEVRGSVGAGEKCLDKSSLLDEIAWTVILLVIAQ